MNKDATCGNSDAKVTQPDSRPVRYQLIGPSGDRLSIYNSALEAATAAGSFWPGIGQRDHDNGAEGWDIEVVRG